MSGWPISTRADISGEDSRREEKKEAGNAGNKRTKLSVGSNLFNDVVWQSYHVSPYHST